MTIDELLQQIIEVSQEIKDSSHSEKVKSMLLGGFIETVKKDLKSVKKNLNS